MVCFPVYLQPASSKKKHRRDYACWGTTFDCAITYSICINHWVCCSILRHVEARKICCNDKAWEFVKMDIGLTVHMVQGSCQIWTVGGTSPPSPSPANSGWHVGRETIFGSFKLEFDCHERHTDFDTGALHRISSQIYLAEWFGLGSHVGKIQNVRKRYNSEA